MSQRRCYLFDPEALVLIEIRRKWSRITRNFNHSRIIFQIGFFYLLNIKAMLNTQAFEVNVLTVYVVEVVS